MIDSWLSAVDHARARIGQPSPVVSRVRAWTDALSDGGGSPPASQEGRPQRPTGPPSLSALGEGMVSRPTGLAVGPAISSPSASVLRPDPADALHRPRFACPEEFAHTPHAWGPFGPGERRDAYWCRGTAYVRETEAPAAHLPGSAAGAVPSARREHEGRRARQHLCGDPVPFVAARQRQDEDNDVARDRGGVVTYEQRLQQRLERSSEDVAWQARHSEYELAMYLSIRRNGDRLIELITPTVDMPAAKTAYLAEVVGLHSVRVPS